MKSLVAPFVVALGFALTACSHGAAFRPTQNVRAVSPTGQPAAAYEIHTARGEQPDVDVFVWSEGASRQHGRTAIDASLLVRNRSAAAITLDERALALDAFTAQDRPVPEPALTRIIADRGTLTVPPGEASTFRLRYELPVALDPDDLGALRLRWALLQRDGEQHLQFTDFRRRPEPTTTTAVVAYDPLFGYYDPFFWGPPVFHRPFVTPHRVIVERRHR